MTKEDLSQLSHPLRDLEKEFQLLVEPHRPALWRYCRMMTGSPWEAEDLVQETLMKTYATLPKLWQPTIPKAFLFRIATNTWLNQCRKAKRLVDEPWEEEDSIDRDTDPFEARENIEFLVRHLSPRQTVVFLLTEVFDFKAREVAEMAGTTEGTVKALLHRARKKLEEKTGETFFQNEDTPAFSKGETAVVEAYVEAFNRRDPDAIAKLMDDRVVCDIVHIAEEYGKDVVRQNSLEDWSRDPMPMQTDVKVLWNKPVFAVMGEKKGQKVLYDLIELEIEDGKIVKKKDYYFCQDLLTAAAEALDVPAHLNGYSF
ncbi:MAG TPA: sigma-70 family RNA polymerase sigma factor [Bacillales bacterium]|nr:sigma-70 family RNA polymerase sigma factor [Bacillales bacterium]